MGDLLINPTSMHIISTQIFKKIAHVLPTDKIRVLLMEQDDLVFMSLILLVPHVALLKEEIEFLSYNSEKMLEPFKKCVSKLVELVFVSPQEPEDVYVEAD